MNPLFGVGYLRYNVKGGELANGGSELHADRFAQYRELPTPVLLNRRR
jgi:hypothetical protein